MRCVFNDRIKRGSRLTPRQCDPSRIRAILVGCAFVQKFVLGKLDGLAGLAGLADHAGLDIRPTLLRVLTDLYVQKPSHSAEEERHYVELALRLIDNVDAGTCNVVAATLANYPAAPAEVVQRLAPIAALGYPKSQTSVRVKSPDAAADDDELFEPQIPSAMRPPAQPAPSQSSHAEAAEAAIERAGFVELRESFFDADADTRRLILTHLEPVAAPDAPALAAESNIIRYLEQAALASRAQEFTTLLQQSLGVSRAMAMRIIADSSGEPFVVAARALAMPSEVFQRILMFLNPEVSLSVARVYALSDLYLDVPQSSALHLVAIWRAADRAEASAVFTRPAPGTVKGPSANAVVERKAILEVQSFPSRRRA